MTQRFVKLAFIRFRLNRDPIWWKRRLLPRRRRLIRQPQAALAFSTATTKTSSSATAVTNSIVTAAGSLLVAYCGQGANNTSTVTMTDSGGVNVWSQTASGYSSANSSSRCSMNFVANAGAVTTVTSTWSGSLSTTVSMCVYEITGAATSSPEDSSVNSSNNVSEQTATSGALTTTNANDILLFGVRLGTSNSSWNTSSGYTSPTGSTDVRIAIEYQIVSTTQSGVTVTRTWTGNATHAEVFAAFKQAPAAAAAVGTTARTLTGAGM